MAASPYDALLDPPAPAKAQPSPYDALLTPEQPPAAPKTSAAPASPYDALLEAPAPKKTAQELADDPNFDEQAYLAENPDDPTTAEEVAWLRYNKPATVAGAVDATGRFIKGLGKGVVEGVPSMVRGFVTGAKNIALNVGAGVIGKGDEDPDVARRMRENAAGVSSGTTSLLKLAESAKEKLDRADRAITPWLPATTREDVLKHLHTQAAYLRKLKEQGSGTIESDDPDATVAQSLGVGILPPMESMTEAQRAQFEKNIADISEGPGDPTNIPIIGAAMAPGKIVAGTAGRVLKYGGKAVEATGNIAARAIERLAKSKAAAMTPGAVLADVAITGGAHTGAAATGAAAGAATWAGSKLAAGAGKLAREAGEEMLGSFPQAGQSFYRKASKAALQGATAGTVASLPMTLGAESPEEAGAMMGPGTVLGGTIGLVHPQLRATEARAQFGKMVEHGRIVNYGPEDAAILSALPQESQDILHFYRGYFDGATTPDGKPVRVEAHDADSFINQTGQDSRGVYFEDGRLLINVGTKAPNGTFIPKTAAELAAVLAHEGKHAIDQAHKAAQPELYKAVVDAIKKRFTRADGTATPDFLRWIQGQMQLHLDNLHTAGASEAEIGDAMGRISDMNYWLEEASADLGQGLVTGIDLGSFLMPQSMVSKAWDALKDAAATKGVNIPAPGDVAPGDLNLPSAQAAAREVRRQLYALGEEARARREAGTSAKTDTQRIAELQQTLATPRPAPGGPVEAVREWIKAMAAARRELAELTGEEAKGRGRTPRAPKEAPIASPPEVEAEAIAKLAVEGIRTVRARALIRQANAQHQSPILDAQHLSSAALRVSKGNPVQPGEFIPKPVAPVEPIAIPTGDKATFSDETGAQRVITGPATQAPRIGDVVVTREGEIRRVTRAMGDTVDTARPIDPLNARGTKTHKLADVQALTHDYAQIPAPVAGEAPVAPAKPQNTVQPKDGGFIVVDPAGNQVGTTNFPTQRGAEQSIRQKGKGSFELPPPVIDEQGNEVFDILSADDMQGGIYFDGMSPEERKKALPQHLQNLLKSDDPKNAPDAVASRLYGNAGDAEQGIQGFGDGTAETMFSLIAQAIEARRSARDQTAAEKKRQAGEKGANVPADEPAPPAPEPAPANDVPSEPAVATAVSEGPAGAQEPATLSPKDVAAIAAKAESAAVEAAKAHPEYPVWKQAKKSKFTLQEQKDRFEARRKNFIFEQVKDAGLDAVAAAHAAGLPTNYQGVRERTNPLGEKTISGTFNPSRPFDAFLLKLADLSETATGILLDLQTKIGQTVTVNYGHAPETGGKVTAEGRKAAQATSSAQARASGEAPTQAEDKNFIPLEVRFNKGKDTPSITILGASPEKLLSNFNHAMDAVRTVIAKLGIEMETPYRDVHDPKLVADMKAVSLNHANGWKGDGSARIESFPDVNVPAPSEGFKPIQIPTDRFDFLNLILGDESAKTRKKGTSPEQKLKQGLAVKNQIPMTEEGETNQLRQVINQAMGPVPVTKKVTQPDGSVKAEPVLNEDGTPKTTTWSKVHLEDPLSENLRVDLINEVKPELSNEDASIRPHGYKGQIDRFFAEGSPSRTFTAAGFMPADTAGSEGRGPAMEKRAAKLWAEQGTESPFFKKWFGQSKAVDQSGSPKVVFHGTNAEFEEFDSSKRNTTAYQADGAFWFSDSEPIAGSYGENVKPAYLSLQNPFIFDKKVEVTTYGSTEPRYPGDVRPKRYALEITGTGSPEWFSQKRYSSKSEAQADADAANRSVRVTSGDMEAAVKHAKENGHDGIIFKNTDDGIGVSEKSTVYGAFRPEQIKSATGNRGTFDPKNPDIRFMPSDASEGPKTPQEKARERIAKSGQPSPSGQEARGMSLFRAQTERDAPGELRPFTSYAVDKEAAAAYTDNQGFGGPHIVRVVLPDGVKILDVNTRTVSGMKRLAENIGLTEEDGQNWWDSQYRYPWEESKKVRDALEASEFDLIRYPDDFPEGATTIVPVRPVPNLDKAMKRSGDEWTDRDLKILEESVAVGKSNAEIAALLGRTEKSVNIKKYKTGVSHELPVYKITGPDGAEYTATNLNAFIESNAGKIEGFEKPARKTRPSMGFQWALRTGKTWKGWAVVKVSEGSRDRTRPDSGASGNDAQTPQERARARIAASGKFMPSQNAGGPEVESLAKLDRNKFANGYAIHFDLRPEADARIDSIMSEGLRSGMVSSDIDNRTPTGMGGYGERAYARGYGRHAGADKPGSIAYVLKTEDVNSRDGRIKPGAKPVAWVRFTGEKQSVRDILREAAGAPVEPGPRFMPDSGTPTPEEEPAPSGREPSGSRPNPPLSGETSAEDTTPKARNENLMEEAEAAGIQPSLETIKGVLRSDKPAMDKLRAMILEKTGQPAKFMPGAVEEPVGKFSLIRLPRDMREQLFNEWAVFVNPEGTEREFSLKRVPTGWINIEKVEINPRIAGDQLNGYREASTGDFPPVVIADGKLTDGQHRIALARERGIKRLRYIDVTGLTNTDPIEGAGFVSELPKFMPDAGKPQSPRERAQDRLQRAGNGIPGLDDQPERRDALGQRQDPREAAKERMKAKAMNFMPKEGRSIVLAGTDYQLKTKNLRPNHLYVWGNRWESYNHRPEVQEIPYRGDPAKAFLQWRDGEGNVAPHVIMATDSKGNPSKVLSPNGKMADFGTPEADYIAGDIDAFTKDRAKRAVAAKEAGKPEEADAAIQEQISEDQALSDKYQGYIDREMKEDADDRKKKAAGKPVSAVDNRFDSWDHWFTGRERRIQSFQNEIDRAQAAVEKWKTQLSKAAK